MIKQDFCWQKFLLKEQKNKLSMFDTTGLPNDTFDTSFNSINYAMQEKYPGNYRLGYKYDITLFNSKV